MKKLENVLQAIYQPERLDAAWRQVKRNGGAAGVDRMSVEDFAKREKELLALIGEKLQAGKYRFKPARRVEIPKPGTTKKRKLGIPTVMDRIASQSANIVLEIIFDYKFSKSSYGFRKGKSQHMAMAYCREVVNSGLKWAVSIDLKSFFDEIPHDLILRLLKRKINDEGFITFVARALKSGVIEEGQFVKTTKGTPQGSPLSPILSNIVLDELDKELEKRNHKFCRWADDFLIFVKSKRSAERVMESVCAWLENELGLPVNREKSGVVNQNQMEFLGFKIYQGKIMISKKSLEKFKDRVRQLTVRNNPLSMSAIMKELNLYLNGWIAYFRMQESKSRLKDIDNWIRKRLRSMQLKKWKKPKRFRRFLVSQGWPPFEAAQVHVKMNRWRSAGRIEVNTSLNPKWFRKLGLTFLNDFSPRT